MIHLKPIYKMRQILYNKKAFLQGSLAERRHKKMTSFDLIWKLIELLLQNNNNKDQEQNKE